MTTPVKSRDEQTITQAPSGWQVAPYALVRFAGKPYQDVAQLHLTQTWPLLTAWSKLDTQTRNERDALCDALYQKVGQTDQRETRKLLVAIKRNIYNERTLDDDALDVLSAAFDDAFVQRVNAFYEALETLEQQHEQLLQTFEQELAEKRAFMQTSMQDENFQHGLLISQPALWRRLHDTYLKADPQQLRSKERSVEKKLFRYFLRMTTKTSPFARFGPVSLAHPAESTQYRLDSGRMTGKVRFNQEVAASIAAKLGQNPAIAAHLYPSVNPTLQIVDGQIRFQAQKLVNRSGVLKPVPTYRTGPARDAVVQLIQLLNTAQDGTLTLHAFIRHACETIATTPAMQQQTVKYIQHLVASDCIRVAFRLTSDRMNRLQEIKQQLSSIPGTDELQQALSHLADLTDNVADATPRDRAAHIRTMTKHVGHLVNDENTHYANYLLEDATLPDAQFVPGDDWLQAVRADLGLLCDCLLARDQGGHGYHILKHFFLRTYGTGGAVHDLAEFASAYARYLMGQISQEQAEPVNAWHQRLTTYMTRLAQTDHPDSIRPILQELLHEFGGDRSRAESLAIIGQIAASDLDALRRGDFLFVINNILPGFGHFFSRYGYLFEEATRSLTDDIRQTLQQYEASHADDVEVVEILSVLHNNAQIHEPFTQRQIIAPGERSQSDPAQQIPVQALRLHHDPQTDELVLTENGQRLQPMYMGFFHTMALQGVHRILADLSPTGAHIDHLKPASYPYFTAPPVPVDDNGIQRHPRLTLGRVVLQRESWNVPAGNLLSLLNDLDDRERFFRVARWARQTGLPQQVFVRTGLMGALSKDDNAVAGFSTGHKPVMLDFANFFAVREFLDMLTDLQGAEQASVIFEEMLPAPESVVAPANAPARVFELQIQLEKNMSVKGATDDTATE